MADRTPDQDHGSAAAAGRRSLAHRPDFALGVGLVRPSLRRLEGPGGSASVEPRVMQVLLAFADAGGKVLSRDDLVRLCWEQRIVGDDSVNRAIAEVRRVARATAAGFTIVTIPRVGYRLDGADLLVLPSQAVRFRPSRRWLVAGGLAAAATAGIGLWTARRSAPDPRAATLIEQAKAAQRLALPDARSQGVDALTQAVALDPDNAEAWGLLALAHRNTAENTDPARITVAVEAMDRAARRALAVDPREGNALTALATINPAFGDWLAAEQRLLAVLKVAPQNVAAISSLVVLLQQVNRKRDSWAWNERAIALDPLSPVHQYRRALKQWIFGDHDSSDNTIERALQLWPRHPAIWNTRLITFAFTGRERAGLSFLDEGPERPPTASSATIAFWRSALSALATRSAADIAATRHVMLDAASRGGGAAVNAIMVMSALGDLDTAFAIAQGYLLRRGPVVGRLRTGSGQMPVNDMRWRRAMFIFTPATAAMRQDPRFRELCDGIGLTDYWTKRGIKPDPD